MTESGWFPACPLAGCGYIYSDIVPWPDDIVPAVNLKLQKFRHQTRFIFGQLRRRKTRNRCQWYTGWLRSLRKEVTGSSWIHLY